VRRKLSLALAAGAMALGMTGLSATAAGAAPAGAVHPHFITIAGYYGSDAACAQWGFVGQSQGAWDWWECDFDGTNGLYALWVEPLVS
jgi:hypothetical protein